MERSSIGRWSGVATIIGGLLWAVGGTTALNYESLGIDMDGPHLVLSLGGLLTLIGLARIGTRHAGDYGRVGVTGVIVASAGVVGIIASKLPSNLSEGAAWNVFYAGGFLLVIGSLIFGTVAWYHRAWLFGAPLLAVGVFAIFNIVFLMVLAEPGLVGTVVLPILVGLAWTVLGYGLWSQEAKTTAEPSAAPADRPRIVEGASAADSPVLSVMEGVKKD